MAERFSGKYSPSPSGADPAPRPQGASRAEKRTGWLFLVALPFAVKAFFQDPAGLTRNLAAFAVLVLAAWLTREGIRAAEAYAARSTARRPALPRKMIGSILTALGLGIGAASGGEMAALLLGLTGAALHLYAFGPDPTRDKGMEGIDTFQQDRVGRIVAEGEAYLKEMRAAADRAGDRQITARVDRFAITARTLFRTVEEDPRDLTAARRYLGVYLMGARDATIKFADLWTKTRDAGARADYEALLDDLETNFAQRTTALLTDNRSDLDIEIGVLRDRLKREGVRLDPYPPKSGE
ncbi:5-bromo-4-chloroindolyl phosphate hydrolysis family protein [Defluviimonas sp. SAOS-178_SWC]|uniref:5-bromo-4-chloroindolyl phosphate hydrolysis family protein n=1 Tax=Defluviimonas sp. SAOS-178_SWC TaxID=3121287 RepID=UPI003221D600